MLGICRGLIGFFLQGMDPQLLHQPVDALVGAAECRFQQMIQAVQPHFRIFFMQMHELPRHLL